MTELRALEVMRSVPTGCVAFPITDDRSMPHLKLGEFAVVDTTDRVPAIGELFAIQWEGGRRDVVVVLRGGFGGTANLVVAPYAPSFDHEGKRLRVVEGPYRAEHLASKLVGRIVGVFISDFEKRLNEG
jgi:hypothetical protein